MKTTRRIMATLLLVLGAFALGGCDSAGAGGGDSDLETYDVGDTGPAGGIVFYDKGADSDGWRYLEAWTADDGKHQWKTDRSSTSGTSTDVGSGYANTYDSMTGTEHPAADIVRNATHGGYDDWFLPSRDELDEMMSQKDAIGGFSSDYYWASSESASDGAHAFGFASGSWGARFKDEGQKVRAVRVF
ncbi:MAG: DUF1566 domain-containing protein [Spirochaetes bacterium]|jgi:hypothetical protein|nr:DUF1566 domain-containing protein [Spirochaetota bacterium]